MNEANTTAAVQEFLDRLPKKDSDSPAEPIVRDLLDRAVRRLRLLCATFLNRNYPRLTKPPLNLQTDELLSAIVERLLKAMREARPKTVRQFFGMVNQHIRWELNDLARRFDEQTPVLHLADESLRAPESSASGLSPVAQRMLDAIDSLPEEESEVFGLVRIQGMSQAEAAELLGVARKTVQRRLNRGLIQLAKILSDEPMP